MTTLPPLPDKEFFSIGEASRIADVKAYVLRYWESEFKLLRPLRRNSGQRKYVRKDLEVILKIKNLLHDRKFTIAGAKKYLIDERRKDSSEAPAASDDGVQLNFQIQQPQAEAAPALPHKLVNEVKEELQEILKLLK